MKLKRFSRAMATVGAGLRILLSLGLALVFTLLVFLVLPFLQEVTKPPESDTELRAVSATLAPPPPSTQKEEEPEKEPEEDEPPPELMADLPPMDLASLELALNPGGVGAGVGGVGAASIASLTKGAGQAQGDDVFSLADLDQPPRVVFQPPPEYPASLRKRNVEGTANVIFLVDKAGRVQNPTVQSSSHPEFEQPALKAVGKWKFEPGRRKGQPVQFRMRVPIAFRRG